jgi:hypothetical protein
LIVTKDRSRRMRSPVTEAIQDPKER